MSIAIGQTIDTRYRIDRLIATGGMGTVYQAHDLRLDRPTALKVMRADVAADPEFQRRFALEAWAAAKLQHQHIVAITDYVQATDYTYLVMEYVTGGSLRDQLECYRRQGKLLPLPFVLKLARQAAEGLAAAHAAGLIHRDIKPDNLLLAPATALNGGPRYTLKIADFGIARVQQPNLNQQLTSHSVGTQGYAAPEQIQGRPVDGRSDIFSLGVVLFELLSGELPPYGDPVAARAVLLSKRGNLGPVVEAIILRCIDFDPGRRFPQAVELMQALHNALLAAVPEQRSSTPQPMPAQNALTAMPGLGASTNAPPTYLPPGATLTTPRLRIQDPRGTVTHVELQLGALEVGREVVGGVALVDNSVSRRHLQIDWDGAQATVTDLASSNGSQLNGQSLSANLPTPWPVKTALQLGGHTLYLELPQAAPTTIINAQPQPTPTVRMVPQPTANTLSIIPIRPRSPDDGEYMLALRNNSSTPITYHLRVDDADAALHYRLWLTTIRVTPGSEEQIELLIYPKQPTTTVERTHQFTFTAQPTGGGAALTVRGEFVQAAEWSAASMVSNLAARTGQGTASATLGIPRTRSPIKALVSTLLLFCATLSVAGAWNGIPDIIVFRSAGLTEPIVCYIFWVLIIFLQTSVGLLSVRLSFGERLFVGVGVLLVAFVSSWFGLFMPLAAYIPFVAFTLLVPLVYAKVVGPALPKPGFWLSGVIALLLFMGDTSLNWLIFYYNREWDFLTAVGLYYLAAIWGAVLLVSSTALAQTRAP